MFSARDFIRFWSQVAIVAGGCAEWQGSTYPSGYGEFHCNGRNHPAHRIALLMSGRALADEEYVLHRCDNRRCVEPSHLFTGTHQDNMDDMAAKGRRASVAGVDNPRSKLTPEQVAAIRSDRRPQRVVAAEYGISKSQVGNIRRGERWVREWPEARSAAR